MRKCTAVMMVGLIVGPGSVLSAAPKSSHTIAAAPVVGAGIFGQTFHLRDSFDLTLERAEYTVARINIGDVCYFPQADEKLLVLHFRVQNPGKDTLAFDSNSVPFAVLDATGIPHESIQDVGLESGNASAQFDLKPGEALDGLYSAAITAADGADTALVIEAGREGMEEEGIRCPLSGHVQPLSAPFSNYSGTTALRQISALKGIFYPLALLDARLDSIAYTTQPLGGILPDPNQRYLTATFTIRNKSAGRHGIGGGNFAALLSYDYGHEGGSKQALLQAETDTPGDTVLEPNAETRVRFFWLLPKTASAETLFLSEGESRRYVFNVSGAK